LIDQAKVECGSRYIGVDCPDVSAEEDERRPVTHWGKTHENAIVRALRLNAICRSRLGSTKGFDAGLISAIALDARK
jgi:hypothetical protein